MRRSLLYVLIAVLLILSGCSSDEKIENLRQLYEQEQPIYNAYPIEVFFDEQVYTVVILDNESVVKGAEFSVDRVARYTVELDLISINEINLYLGDTFRNVEVDFGKYHVDIGSGGFMPSYLTEDGYLIVFSINRDTNIVEHVGKLDLFTGESIEWYFK